MLESLVQQSFRALSYNLNVQFEFFRKTVESETKNRKTLLLNPLSNLACFIEVKKPPYSIVVGLY